MSAQHGETQAGGSDPRWKCPVCGVRIPARPHELWTDKQKLCTGPPPGSHAYEVKQAIPVEQR